MAKSNLIISISIVLIILFLLIGSIFLIPKIQQALDPGVPFDYDFNYGRRNFEEGEKIQTNFNLITGNTFTYSEYEPLGPPFVIKGVARSPYNSIDPDPNDPALKCCKEAIEPNKLYDCGPFLYLDGNLYNDNPLTTGEHNVIIKGYRSNGKYFATCTRYDKEYTIMVTASATTSTTLPLETTTSTSSTSSTTIPSNPCSNDAKLCPDGTYVNLVPPECKFDDCPKVFDWKLLLIPLTIIVLLIAIVSGIIIFRRRRN